MSAKELPSCPSLEFYKKQAKQFLKECVSRNADALRRIREFHPRLAKATDTDLPGPDFALADAQWIIAREHGFESWPKFVHHIEQLAQKKETIAPIDSTVSVQELVAAAQRGDVDAARELLRTDPSLINSKDEEGQSLLYVTAMHGFNERHQSNRAFVVFLITQGVEVDLHAAAFLARPDRVREILARNPKIVHQTIAPYDCTALHYAAERGNLETVKALVESGADLNVRDKFGRTPLAVAAHAGPWKPEPATDVINYLLAHGATLDLYGAAALGKMELLELVLAHGRPDIGARDSGGCTALWHAARNNRFEAVRWLVEHGAPVNAANADGQTALSTAVLHLLARQTEPALIHYLVEKGASLTRLDPTAMFKQTITAHDETGFRLLLELFPEHKTKIPKDGLGLIHEAAKNGNLDIVRHLVEQGVSVNLRDESDNATPLHWAAEEGREDVVRYLVEHGADIHATDDAHERGPLGWATVFEHTHREVADFLISKGAQPDIFTAVALGDMALVRHMAEKDPGVLEQTMSSHDDLRHPLHLAIIKDNLEMVVLLHELGANLSARTAIGKSPLSVAAEHKRRSIITWLKQHGAEINVLSAIAEEDIATVRKLVAENPASIRPGGTYETAIHDAASIGNNELVEFFLDHGAGINEQDNDRKCTPLHLAAFNGHVDTLKLLVKRGADVGAKDRIHQSPARGWAVYNKQDAAAAYLESVQPKSSKTPAQEVIEAARVGHAWRLQELLKQDPLLANARDNEGEDAWTALHHAVGGENVESARVLLQSGAEVDSRDARDKTPFFWAIMNRDFSVAELLLQYGADVNARFKGYSLLHHEAKDGKAATVEFMLKHGANPNIRDDRVQPGSTPLHGAARQGRLNVAKLLIEHGADVHAKTDMGQTPLDAARGSKKQKVVDLLLERERDASGQKKE